MTTFNQLGLSNQVLKAIQQLGFEKPTEIQAAAIPQLLQADRDFIGLAQTGTGKTAAFGLPLIELVDENSPFTQGLILAPTRELGQQIAEQIEAYSKYLKRVNVLAVYGGASIINQIRALEKPRQIIIATPGRLIDLIKRKAVDLTMLDFLILDEADEMVNMGFKEELDEILKHTPETKLTWLFSATMPKEIKRIVDTYMKDPMELSVNQKDRVNVNIVHQFVNVDNKMKAEALTRFLDMDPEMHSVVFCRTRKDTQDLADFLQRKKYNADALHGDLSQAQRDRVMKLFKNRRLNVLVATDVAARGIDVNDLTHVFHYSLPDEIAYYTHRSGRTARAGKTGKSVALVNGRDWRKLQSISHELQIDIENVEIPGPNEIKDSRLERWCLDVLSQHPKGKLDSDLLGKAILLFGALSKEELISKLISRELDSLGIQDDTKFTEGKPSGNSGRSREHRGEHRDNSNHRHNSSRRANQDYKKKRNRKNPRNHSGKKFNKKKHQN